VDNGAPVDFSTVRLFRYSAVTFNGHRIHYDENYARQAEGYSGLVVHGPLQATILAHAAMTKHDRPITKFGFRGTAALIGPTRAFLHAGEMDGKTLLSLTDNRGRKTMEAWASCRQ
jgi:hydroxyacyl-ACP dehydratase HTD2-like protein with hotdog domain